MTDYVNKATEWAERGGPTPSEYETFAAWLKKIAAEVEEGQVDASVIKDLRFAFGKALSTSTLQGISLVKPRGYAGDFEVIDRVYQRSMTTDPQLLNWDHYLLNTQAAQAVRNRKDYFIELIKGVKKSYPVGTPFKVLNIASGPSRDVFEYLMFYQDSDVHFDCVEYDQVAIRYAKALCYEFLDQLNFIKANAFRFETRERYPLVWSGGLFDYFDDRQFKHLLARLYQFVEEGGELVVGNFSEDNPDRPYMEVLMEWELNHRSEDQLRELALACDIPPENITVGSETTGVNLFLHVKK